MWKLYNRLLSIYHMSSSRHLHSSIIRRRSVYLALVLISIPSGLLSRSFLIPLPGFIVTYAGDTIWASMVFFLLCIIFPKWKTINIAIAALTFSYGIELSQFYHSPWIDELRQNKIGGLILGFGFKASDLACYTLGIFVASVIDTFLIYRFNPSHV